MNFIPSVLRTLSRDGWLLFATRFARLFAYGWLDFDRSNVGESGSFPMWNDPSLQVYTLYVFLVE
jgi:hypothetical protein